VPSKPGFVGFDGTPSDKSAEIKAGHSDVARRRIRLAMYIEWAF
jgi:hypothetical protein